MVICAAWYLSNVRQFCDWIERVSQLKGMTFARSNERMGMRNNNIENKFKAFIDRGFLAKKHDVVRNPDTRFVESNICKK